MIMLLKTWFPRSEVGLSSLRATFHACGLLVVFLVVERQQAVVASHLVATGEAVGLLAEDDGGSEPSGEGAKGTTQEEWEDIFFGVWYHLRARGHPSDLLLLVAPKM
jgi:hypothetical protein